VKQHNQPPFYGRSYEENKIQQAIDSNQAELGIVYGRRRIGKSSLLMQFKKRKGDLYFEALGRNSNKETEDDNYTTPKQIAHFVQQLAKQTQSPPVKADTWDEAFDALTYVISTGKHYVVFDEFPWMAVERTELVSKVKFYWDNHWKKNPAITLVLCGSIMSYMVKHVVHSHVLHNRKTFEIKLDPLPAHEAKKFFKNYRSDFEIAKFLMIFGGIPKYLEQINPKVSLSENMDRLCFQKDAFFVSEFETVFKEQFKVVKIYEEIVSKLAKKSSSKEDLAHSLHKQTRGGGLNSYLKTLENADFVKKFSLKTIGLTEGTKTIRYVLWDDWIRFYLSYVAPQLQMIQDNTEKGLFDAITGSSIEAYFGLAFERLCFKNISNIIKTLGIPKHQILGYGPFFRQASRKKKNKQNSSEDIQSEGIQIDALIRRKGNVLTMIECKYYSDPVGKGVIKDVERKIKLLDAPKKYTVEKVLIAANGVTPDLDNEGYFHHILGLDAIFS
jgi:AAA+ ATPase superfamily predicted ATPase